MIDSYHNGSIASGSGHRMRDIELSYGEMTTFSSGAIMSTETKAALRKQHGYCLTCPLIPILLFDIRRSRMNPLWTTKKSRTVEGECLDGKCIKCNPELGPQRGKRPVIVSPPSFLSFRSSQSFDSSITSCSFLESDDAESIVPMQQKSDCQRSGSSRNLSGSNHQARPQRSMPPRYTRSTMNQSRTSEVEGRAHPNQATKDQTPLSRALSMTTKQRRKTPWMNEESNISFCSNSTDVTRYSRAESIGDDKGQKVVQPTSKIERPDKVQVGSMISLCDHQISRSDDVEESATSGTTLQDLTSTIKNVKATGCVDILSECLLSAMETHHSSENVQLLCLTTIADEFNDTFLASFVAVNGVMRVLDALQRFPISLGVQEQGCNALGVLATNKCNRSELIRCGACAHLTKALSCHLGDSALVCSAFTALRILSTETEGRNILRQLTLSKTVKEAMQCNMSSAPIQRDGCAILSNLAVEADKQEVSAVRQSEISVVVNAMQRHVDDESVMASACFTLKNFAYNESNLRIMSHIEKIYESLERAGLFESIFSAEQTMEKMYISMAQDESLEEQAHKNLKAKVAEQSDDPDIMNVVLNCMKEFKWSSRILVACLKILKSLALTSEPHKQKLLGSTNIEQLRTYTEDFASDEGIQCEASILIDLFEEESSGGFV